jgi:hypothetical protein
MPGYPDWGGTPLVTGDLISINVAGAVVTPGNALTEVASVIRPGYNVRLLLQNITNNVTPLPIMVRVTWQDSQSGLTVNKQIWNIYAGTNADAHIIRGNGPTEGDQVQMDIVNPGGSGVNLQCSLLVVQSNRQFTAHDWRTDMDATVTFPGATLALNDVQSNMVAVVNNQAIAANTTLALLLPLIAGPAVLSLFTTAAASAIRCEIDNGADTSIGGAVIIGGMFGGSTTLGPHKINLPRSQSFLNLINTTAAGITVWCGIVSENL